MLFPIGLLVLSSLVGVVGGDGYVEVLSFVQMNEGTRLSTLAFGWFAMEPMIRTTAVPASLDRSMSDSEEEREALRLFKGERIQGGGSS